MDKSGMPSSWDHAGELPYYKVAGKDPFWRNFTAFLVLMILGVGGFAFFGKQSSSCACERQSGRCGCKK
jgi:hypothetical protein